MITSKKFLIIALVIPIIALLTLTLYKQYALSFGKESLINNIPPT
jgi:hypothetical protein